MDFFIIVLVIVFVLAVAAFLAGIAFGIGFCVFGLLPLGVVNGFLSLTGNERRMPSWVMPYMGWGGSLAGLTLLSAVANWQTRAGYSGAVGAWATVTLIEGAVTAAGIALAWRAYGKQLIRVQELQEAGADVSDAPPRAYIFGLLWVGGILAFNWIVDMIYVLSVGVNVQGIGPGWIDLVEGWGLFSFF